MLELDSVTERDHSETEFIQCFGFCGDPAIIRSHAQNLLHIVNAGEAVNTFIKSNSPAYLCQKNMDLYQNADILGHWVNDARESIVTLATTIALGCRRLFQTQDVSTATHRTVNVGKVLTPASHDKWITGDDLDFIHACSRLIHAIEWRIATACTLSRTPGSALEIKTDSGGKYEICLSGFSLAAWMMTKEFSYRINESGMVSSPPNLTITTIEG